MTDANLASLLDRLDAMQHRDEQITLLREWVRELREAWRIEHAIDDRERLGKLGGG